jgi:trehalose 6-phosphate phosphatase
VEPDAAVISMVPYSEQKSMMDNFAKLPTASSHPHRLPPPFLPAVTEHWALFLDVDGTLLELAETPDAVVVPTRLPDLLLRLRAHMHGALALISGRAISAVDRLLAPLRLPCAGLHGFERRDAQGVLHTMPVDTGALAQMQYAAQQLSAAMPDILFENKGATAAFHFRAAPQREAQLHSELTAIARATGFVVQPGVFLYELKPAGVDKGHALKQFLAEPPFAGCTPIFLGDDVTDEYALAAARHCGGIAIQVGPRKSAAANFALADPAAVAEWLEQWASQWP